MQPGLSAVPSEGHLFRLSPCLQVQFDMLSPPDTHIFFLFLPSVIFDNLFLPFYHQVKESTGSYQERNNK